MPNAHPQPLRPEDEHALRTVLPNVIKKFSTKTDYSGITDAKAHYDAWFEMPGQTERYASLGFEFGGKPLYWTVPVPPPSKVLAYPKAGYTESSKYFWKYVALPQGFSNLQSSEQERILFELIVALLEEDERLRGE